MREGRKRVVVTGIGAVTPMASSAEGTWRGMVEGRSAIDYITLFDASAFPTTFAGQVRDESVVARFKDDPELFRAGRNIKFAVVAATEAFEDARLDEAEIDKARFGVYLGAGEGPPDWDAFGNLLADSWDGSKVDTARFMSLGAARLDPMKELFQEPNLVAGAAREALRRARAQPHVPHRLRGLEPGDRRGDRHHPPRRRGRDALGRRALDAAPVRPGEASTSSPRSPRETTIPRARRGRSTRSATASSSRRARPCSSSKSSSTRRSEARASTAKSSVTGPPETRSASRTCTPRAARPRPP